MAILTPYGFVPGQFPSEAQSIGPDVTYAFPHDPQHNTSGEDGFYSDTHLGGASGPQVIAQGPTPSDFQHARAYQYTPSVRGWTSTPGGWVQGSYYPQAAGGPARYPASALGDAAATASAAAAGATGYATPAMTAAEREEARRKNISYWISVGTAVAVGGSALLAIFRTVKGLRHDQMIRTALEKKLI
jgi:hypothetical protein